jgi:alpha,alpha-trehalose phosphorylase
MIHHERLRAPSHDYPADEWNVIEKAFRPEFLAQSETMLALGNGYLGMRGCPEEGGPNAENSTLINGFYETSPIVYPEDAYGFAKTGQTIIGVTDSKTIKLFVDDEPFWLPNAKLLSYDRRLNMKSGTLDREILWETPAGKQVLITSLAVNGAADGCDRLSGGVAGEVYQRRTGAAMWGGDRAYWS